MASKLSILFRLIISYLLIIVVVLLSGIYTIWNLRLNYAPPKARWAVFAGVRNLSDESFIAQRTTGSFIGIQPGEIRNFYGGVSWRF